MSSYPTVSEILRDGWPPEWIPFIVLCCVMALAVLALDGWMIYQHKRFSTKHPIQFLSTVGVLQVYPIFVVMHTVGLIVPKAHDMTLFISEGYEAISFLLFLRLVLTYMGGKKATNSALQGKETHLNLPPFCCFVCLPKIKYSTKYFIFCEFLIVFYALFCLFVGFVDLVITLDDSQTFGTSVSTTFGIFYHFSLLVLLVLSVYGLSGIYHSAEDRLGHRRIVKKFLVYKVFTLLAKLQDVVMGTLVTHKVIPEGFGYDDNFTSSLRVRNILAFVIVVEATLMFPLALSFYDTTDYYDPKIIKNPVKEESPMKEESQI